MEAESEEEDDDDDDDGKKVSGDITQSWASVIFSCHHVSLFVLSVLFSVLHVMLNVCCALLFCSLRAPSFTCRWWCLTVYCFGWVFRVQCFPRTTPDTWWKVILHNFHFNRQFGFSPWYSIRVKKQKQFLLKHYSSCKMT